MYENDLRMCIIFISQQKSQEMLCSHCIKLLLEKYKLYWQINIEMQMLYSHVTISSESICIDRILIF